jgi:endonuclease/exonuclease/phosphatase family metal-dependent hydrolase
MKTQALKMPLILALIFLTSCGAIQRFNPSLRVLHYNIYELDSGKLTEENNEQLRAVKVLIEDESFNIFSVNELQFDVPQVPNKDFITYGENLNKLMNKIGGHKDWNTSFFQANTGNKAKKKKGEYLTPKKKGARSFADPVNYGLFPGQYSTGLATTYEIEKKIVLTELPWKTFNPKAKIRRFRDAKGKHLPKDMPLFDKNFVDTVIKVQGKEVHLITLHTVPAYHFGNKRSPNYERNRDQLRFLEWYLTGHTDIDVDPSKFPRPVASLPEGTTFIAMGDWNTDIANKKNPGSKVLKRISDYAKLLPAPREVTQESFGFNPKRLKMALDYIAYSDDLKLEEFKVIRPKEKRLFLGCGKDPLPLKDESKRVHASYFDKTKKKKCHLTVSKNFHLAKTASDHFPLLAKFNFK